MLLRHSTAQRPGPAVAKIADDHLCVILRAAAPLTLQGDHCWRTDGNSPVLCSDSEVILFFSHYEPRGHTLRRSGRHFGDFTEVTAAVELLDDPDPTVGKWIEAVWQDPDGSMRGWYHAEEPVLCPQKLFAPHIGELVSEDGGRRWRCVGEVLRLPSFDCSWQNGFIVGGYGDLCLVPDCTGERLYLFFTSYHMDERAQGVAVARLSTNRTRPLEMWCDSGWQSRVDLPPKPLWPVRLGWRHAGPDSFWGPAVHYNRALKRYVMLLNRTAGGAGDLRQEGIYVSTSATLEEPTEWTRPLKLVSGGAWYPQVIGVAPGDGDSRAGATARFFMAGFSAWQIDFTAPAETSISRPLTPTRQDFVTAFGDRRCPW
jgi:hypothetical protein